MNMELNPSHITQLMQLLKQEEDSSSSDDDIPRAGISKIGPGHIKPRPGKENDTKPVTGKVASAEVTPEDEKSIWRTEEANEDVACGTAVDNDPRATPQYTTCYGQEVSAEDAFLQMGNKTPSSVSCEWLQVHIQLPGESRQDLDLEVTETRLELRGKHHRFSLPIPHRVDPDQTRAKWHCEPKCQLDVSLRLIRDLDFVNF